MATGTDKDAIARLRASKDKYLQEREAANIARVEEDKRKHEAGVKAGREWALHTATYEQLRDFMGKHAAIVSTYGGSPAAGHDSLAFQNGARAVFDEIEADDAEENP